MNPGLLQHLFRTLRKAAPSIAQRFSGKGRHFGARGLERGPVRIVYSAIKKGPMTRREFLGRSAKIGIESKDLAALSKVSMGLRNRQKRAHSWLIANEPKIKRFYSNPEKYSKSFKELLKKQENVAVYGHGEGWFGYPHVGKLEKKFHDIRDLLAKKYGHEYGSYTFLNEAFPGAKYYVQAGGRGISHYGLDPNVSLPLTNNPLAARGKGILRFITDVKKKRSSNPIFEAYREGRWG